jgi:hypothetical protein
VLRPPICHQTIGDRPQLVPSFGFAGVKRGRNIADGAPFDLSVLPELGCLVIAYGHCGGSKEQGELLRRELKIEAAPHMVLVGAAERKPAQS